MSEESDPGLLGRLARLTAAGKLDAGASLPVMGELAGPVRETDQLYRVLDDLEEPVSPLQIHLRAHIHEQRLREVLRCRSVLSNGGGWEGDTALVGDLPVPARAGWDDRWDAQAAIRRIRELFPDVERLRESRADVPMIRERIAAEEVSARDAVLKAMEHCGEEFLNGVQQRWSEQPGGDQRAGELDARSGGSQTDPAADLVERFNVSTRRQERSELLDQILCLPDARFAESFLHCSLSTSEVERAELVLTLRFGRMTDLGWEGWLGWLLGQAAEEQSRRAGIMRALLEDPVLWLLWYRSRPDRDESTERWLRSLCPPPARMREFTARWADWLSREEWQRLDPDAVRVPAEAPPLPGPGAELKVIKGPPEAGAVAQQPAIQPVRAPSVWQSHVQPLLSENWYVFAGMAMVIAGASLLAYYTWDKVWWLRYTIMPGLLALFTGTPPKIADWMEGRAAEFRDTGAILRGAAIGLLPLNFMVPALLARDENVSGSSFMALLLAAVYLVVFGLCLVRWCRAVHPSLARPGGAALLFLTALVAGVPMWNGLTGTDGTCPAFYVGFLVMGATINVFGRRVTLEMVEDGRFPWFLGATLVGTFAQAFAWVHGFLGLMPSITSYAPMAIGFGWLVLFAERRHLQLYPAGEHSRHQAESFMGYAFVLIGILMGAGAPWMRVTVFGLAGWVWLYQARDRSAELHYWIGLMLLVLAGASVGLVSGFPRQWLPGLGVGMALGLVLVRRVAGRQAHLEMKQAAGGLESGVLVLTAVVGVLGQWHHHTAPVITGGWLLIIAGILLAAALYGNHPGWLLTAMAVLALALPYLGCIDLEKRTLHGNTMVFGLAVLSLLWMVVTGFIHHPVVREARSTVLWGYGVLATTAMIVRVLLEQGSPVDPSWYLNFKDQAGPLMMSVVLVFAAACSRSLIPSLMAIIIVVILFPELKTNLEGTFLGRNWGSGLGSAVSALALVLGSFWLRGRPWMRDLSEGDRFLGREPFPLRRHDHTLFTWPMLVAAVVLAIRVDTWILARNLLSGAAGMRTAWAVLLTAIIWPALAVYCRDNTRARFGAVAGVVCLFVGLELLNRNLKASWGPLGVLMVGALILRAAESMAEWLERRRRPWLRLVVVSPWVECSRVLSLIAVVTSFIVLLFGRGTESSAIPSLVFGVLLAWHGKESGHPVFGVGLYVLVQTAVADWIRRRVGELVWVDLLVAVVWVNAMFMLPNLPRIGAWRKPHRTVLSWTLGCSVIVNALIGIGMAEVAVIGNVGAVHSLWWPLFVALGLGAWLHRSGFLALLLLVLAYEFLLVRDVPDEGSRFLLLLESWRLGLFAVFMVALYRSAGSLLGKAPAWLRPGVVDYPWFRHDPERWLLGAATGVAFCAVFLHSMDPRLRAQGLQTMTPYLAAVALGWIGWLRRRGWYQTSAVACAFVGNHHLVRVFLGDSMKEAGLSRMHVFCLGLAVSLGQVSLLRGRIGVAKAGALNLSGFWLGGTVLSVLTANYFVEADLSTIGTWRFLFSGTLAMLVGWYFRQVAMSPCPDERVRLATARALYHFGVITAIWCGSLMLPFLRSPAMVLIPLALPIFYFHLRAEAEFRAGTPAAEGYRVSATVMGFLLLALYAGRGALQMFLFPGVPLEPSHYHQNAPLLSLVALVLLRLHGLGGSHWSAFYGGCGLMVGTFLRSPGRRCGVRF